MITFQRETLLFLASFGALFWAYRIHTKDGVANGTFALVIILAVALFLGGVLAG